MFKLNINIKGKNIAGLLVSVAGGIAGIIFLISNPAGWVVLALSIVGLVFSVAKLILGVVNHDYRKSQQKKSADENIKKIGENIIKSIEENLKEADEPLKSGIESIKKALINTIDHVKIMNKILLNAGSGLKKLAHSIETKGDS
jgi:hypothetical protein